jgi:hypothetical protein
MAPLVRPKSEGYVVQDAHETAFVVLLGLA